MRGKRTAERLTLTRVKAAKHSGATYTGKDGRPRDRQEVLWDTEVRGLGLRLLPDRKVWCLRYRWRGRPKLRHLEPFGALTLEQARDAARSELGRLADAARNRAKTDPLARPARRRTLTAIAPEWLASISDPEKTANPVKASTLAKYREALATVQEDLGSRPLDEVEERDLERAFARWTRERGPYAANRAAVVARMVYRYAERIGERDKDTDPTATLELHAERKRGRKLTAKELARLGEALSAEEARAPELADCVTAIRLLAFTGCRRREITNLTWTSVDLEAGVLRLRDSKTGPRDVPLNTAARQVIATLTRGDDEDRLFPSTKHEVGYAIQYVWNRVRKAAGLDGVRLHDLRHLFVTSGLEANISAALVGGAVGHRRIATTERYAHHGGDSVQRVSETISATIRAGLEGNMPAEVVAIEGAKS